MNHASRLTLFVALGLTACADAPPSTPNEWRSIVSTDSTGGVLSSLIARDAEGEALDGEHFPPSLYLRCDNGQTALYIEWRTDLERDTVEVTYALGGGQERTEQWLTSADHSATGRWSDSLAVPLLEEMLNHDRLRMAIEPPTGRQTWVFPLDGLTEALAPLREACAS